MRAALCLAVVTVAALIGLASAHADDREWSVLPSNCATDENPADEGQFRLTTYVHGSFGVGAPSGNHRMLAAAEFVNECDYAVVFCFHFRTSAAGPADELRDVCGRVLPGTNLTLDDRELKAMGLEGHLAGVSDVGGVEVPISFVLSP